LIMEAGEGILDWRGIRVYLRMRGYETSGELIETIRSQSSNSQTNSANPGGFPDTLATFAAIFSQVKFRGLEFFSPQEGPDVDDCVFLCLLNLIRKKFESLNL
jgi:hypothetical protein